MPELWRAQQSNTGNLNHKSCGHFRLVPLESCVSGIHLQPTLAIKTSCHIVTLERCSARPSLPTESLCDGDSKHNAVALEIHDDKTALLASWIEHMAHRAGTMPGRVRQRRNRIIISFRGLYHCFIVFASLPFIQRGRGTVCFPYGHDRRKLCRHERTSKRSVEFRGGRCSGFTW